VASWFVDRTPARITIYYIRTPLFCLATTVERHDGEKIKASANYRRSKNRKRTKQSYERVKEAVARVLAKPVNEDFTEAKKAARLERLQGQKKDLLSLKAMLEDMEDEEATVNMTDPQAKVMKHKDGRSLPSYNRQSAVDGKMGVVVAVSTTDESGQGHQNVLADPGFCDYETLKQAECERQEEYYLPDRRFEVTEGGATTVEFSLPNNDNQIDD
jgi:hypothetical protein